MRNTQLVEHISKELSVQTKLKNVGIWHQESCLRASSKYPKKQYNQTHKFFIKYKLWVARTNKKWVTLWSSGIFCEDETWPSIVGN